MGCIFTERFICPKRTKKATFDGGLNGGGGGIRTHGTLARTTVFKTAPINRSGTPPKDLLNVFLLYMLIFFCQDNIFKISR